VDNDNILQMGGPLMTWLTARSTPATSEAALIAGVGNSSVVIGIMDNWLNYIKVCLLDIFTHSVEGIEWSCLSDLYICIMAKCNLTRKKKDKTSAIPKT